MEGIPVKISEKYKPPRKITLPASIQNKLNTEIKLDKYDFELERFVAAQMAKLKEQQAKASENKITEESSMKLKFEDNITQDNILTPIPMKPRVQTSIIHQQAMGGFNISDFENDTSSPFDSVELKTINEMEELAHVLGGTQLTAPDNWTSPKNGSTTQNWTWCTSCPNQLPYHPNPHIEKKDDIITQPVSTIDSETSVILQSLRKHFDDKKTVVVPFKKAQSHSSGLSIAGVKNPERVSEKKRETLPNPFSNLNSQSQAVARRIAEMGFPLSRTARAAEIFGPNEGKVIEFVLEIQSLEEQGYPDERAERALVITQFSRDDAVRMLDNVDQIMKLGFGEEEVLSALMNCGFDRDKALDSLIS